MTLNKIVRELEELLAKATEPAPKPLPDQGCRVGEAMAAKADYEARRTWQASVDSARYDIVHKLPTLLSVLSDRAGLAEALEDALAYILGDISGESQRDGILRQGLAALAKHDSSPHSSEVVVGEQGVEQ